MLPDARIAVAIAAILLPPSVAAAESTAISEVVAATYAPYSVLPPTPNRVVVCHGFGCKFRAEVGLTAADRGHLAGMLAAGKASPAAERRAIAQAGAWFDRRIAPAAGTRHHVARAGMSYMFDKGQFDCVDSSRNTTSLLLVLEELKLLHHHVVDVPVARGYLLDGITTPHVTAVLTDKKTGQKWAVDSWTRAYGAAPEIMPLSRWETLE
jgi:hypothetical protein